MSIKPKSLTNAAGAFAVVGGCSGSRTAMTTLSSLDQGLEILLENFFVLFVVATMLFAAVVLHGVGRNARRIGIAVGASVIAIEMFGMLATLVGEGGGSVLAIAICVYAVIQLRSPECIFYFEEENGPEDFPYKLIAVALLSAYFGMFLMMVLPALSAELDVGVVILLLIGFVPLVVHSTISIGSYLRWTWVRRFSIGVNILWGLLTFACCGALLIDVDADPESGIIAIVLAAVYLVLGGFVFWVLTRDDVRNYFDGGMDEALDDIFS